MITKIEFIKVDSPTKREIEAPRYFLRNRGIVFDEQPKVFKAMTTKKEMSKSEVEAPPYEESEEPRYSLRKRKGEFLEPEKKKPKLCVAAREKKPKFVVALQENIKEGTIVLAHMKSFSPWPAKVIGKTVTKSDTKVKVYFLGDHKTGTVKANQIGLIGENSGLIASLLRKKNQRLWKSGS